MKKRTWILAFSVAVVLSVSGCGSKNADNPTTTGTDPMQIHKETTSKEPEERKKVTMWFFGTPDSNREILQRLLVDRFSQENPGYELVIEYRNSVDTDLATALLANQGPDILYGSSPAMTLSFIKEGKYADLTPYAEKYGWKEKMLASFYDGMSVDGKLYNIATGMNLTGMFYYKDVLDENGWKIPETIEDITNIMDEAQGKGLYGGLAGNKGWQPCNEDVASLFLTSFAGSEEIYKALTGAEKWDSEQIKLAVESSAQWFEKGYLGGDNYTNLTYGECTQLLYDKQAPFLFAPSRVYQNVVRTFTDNAENVYFMPLPSGRIGLESTYSIGTTAVLGINENSKCKDEAAKVLDIIMQENFVTSIAKEWPGYWGVPLKSFKCIDESQFTGASLSFIRSMKNAMEALDKGKFGYYVSSFFPPETYNAFVNIDTVWYGTVTAEDMLKEVDIIFAKEKAEGLVPYTPKQK